MQMIKEIRQEKADKIVDCLYDNDMVNITTIKKIFSFCWNNKNYYMQEVVVDLCELTGLGISVCKLLYDFFWEEGVLEEFKKDTSSMSEYLEFMNDVIIQLLERKENNG